MKAILIIDLPKEYIGSEIDINLYCKDGNVIHEKCVNKLKPMPQKKKIRYADSILAYGCKVGWNDCINKILGGNE